MLLPLLPLAEYCLPHHLSRWLLISFLLPVSSMPSISFTYMFPINMIHMHQKKKALPNFVGLIYSAPYQLLLKKHKNMQVPIPCIYIVSQFYLSYLIVMFWNRSNYNFTYFFSNCSKLLVICSPHLKMRMYWLTAICELKLTVQCKVCSWWH